MYLIRERDMHPTDKPKFESRSTKRDERVYGGESVDSVVSVVYSRIRKYIYTDYS